MACSQFTYEREKSVRIECAPGWTVNVIKAPAIAMRIYIGRSVTRSGGLLKKETEDLVKGTRKKERERAGGGQQAYGTSNR